MLTYLQNNELPEGKKMAKEILALSRFMAVANGILIHFWTTTSNKRRQQSIKQLGVPTLMQQQALKSAHNDQFLSVHWE